MGVFQIKKGRDINLKGSAEKRVESLDVPPQVAISPSDFRGFHPRVLVKPGDLVKAGTPLFEHKDHPEMKIVSSVSGKVLAVNRGEERVLLNVRIAADAKQEALSFKTFTAGQISSLSRAEIINQLLVCGVWVFIRQRPFSKIASPQDNPKSIFVQAMNTEPLALDVDRILEGKEREFQLGLDILTKLTTGKVHLCVASSAKSKALTLSQNVEIHQFSGPHPAGNVSTHIHCVDPINQGEHVWYIGAEDVLRVAHVFLKGNFLAERFVAVTGEGAQNRSYKKTVIGAPISHLVKVSGGKEGLRYLSGSVLSGKDAGKDGYVGYYDNQVTVIGQGGAREFLGWICLGQNKFSFSKTFPCSFFGGQREFSLDTDKHGGERAIVLNDVYDDYVALDIMTYFLIKAVLAGEIEEAQKLGILECDEEDFALATFACPSKTDVGAIIRQGLDLIEKEG